VSNSTLYIDRHGRLRVLEDDCITQPCGTHGKCIDDVHGYKCKCELGWEGKNCDQISKDGTDSLESLHSLMHV
jgi:hypothetical protein